MNRICVLTRGPASWRERLGDPEKHWKRERSAMETAVSWELADGAKSETNPGLPKPILKLLEESGYEDPVLLLAIAEHKVELEGQGGPSQCDVWAIVRTSLGMLSLSVEAKERESFGDDILKDWLVKNESDRSKANRQKRWDFIKSHLPNVDASRFEQVRYQILHRCAASVIEAKRWGFPNAAFVVQAFETPEKSFEDYAAFCDALGLSAKSKGMESTSVDGLRLDIGWADCPLAKDKEVASVL